LELLFWLPFILIFIIYYKVSRIAHNVKEIRKLLERDLNNDFMTKKKSSKSMENEDLYND